MSRRKKKPGFMPLSVALLLAAGAALLFLGGELWKLSRSDSGRVLLAARFGLGDPARVTQTVGREIRRGLLAAGVPADSIRESVGQHAATVVWDVGLRPEMSLFQTNDAITRCVTSVGAEVISGAERAGSAGETVVTLRIGLSRRVFHEVRLLRRPRIPGSTPRETVRLAIVLYDFPASEERAEAEIATPVPFAAALEPGGPTSARLFHAAAARRREIVLHLPLEPLHYPQVNPGPGTILVTMNEPRITGLVRRHLEQAGSVVAVANDMGSLATQDMTVMTAVFRELKRQNLPFVHMQPAAGAVCRPLAARLGVGYLEPDMIFDELPGPGVARRLDERWKKALAMARARGRLLVMMRATPTLIAWLPGATSLRRLEGVNLVPLSSLVRKPMTLP
jgi:polysaccharide deacetylase 2 family uncharacterized protein YibQ